MKVICTTELVLKLPKWRWRDQPMKVICTTKLVLKLPNVANGKEGLTMSADCAIGKWRWRDAPVKVICVTRMVYWSGLAQESSDHDRRKQANARLR
jgi:hypothetical protein